MESFILFYEKCRLCLDEPGVQDIFQAEGLSQNILLCTGVMIKKSDNLPQKVCSKCLKIINNAKELRVVATKNDTHLRSLFAEEKPDTYEDVEDDEDSDRLVIAETSKVTIRKETRNVKEPSKKSSRSIKVRKDLFEPQTVVTSSTKSVADSVSNTGSKSTESRANVKRFKKEFKNDDEFKCEVCGKVFDKWKKFYLHQRLHNKKFNCPLDGCDKKFALKSDLEKHLRIHTGVKPYRCEVCSQCFTQNSSLKSHIKSLHKELVDSD